MASNERITQKIQYVQMSKTMFWGTNKCRKHILSLYPDSFSVMSQSFEICDGQRHKTDLCIKVIL